MENEINVETRRDSREAIEIPKRQEKQTIVLKEGSSNINSNILSFQSFLQQRKIKPTPKWK